jgi:hypothetical protein
MLLCRVNGYCGELVMGSLKAKQGGNQLIIIG